MRDRAQRDVAPLFLPMVTEWQQLAAGYTDDELALIVEFYARMEQVFRDQVIRLRALGESRPPPAPPG